MLGVRPTHPSSSYGYIRPSGMGLSAVAAFVEKPDQHLAQKYVDEGYLWNSGNFIVTAETLLNELRRFAPGVEAPIQAALPAQDDTTVQLLLPSFASAQKISIDYAVMERTALASVMEVDFEWRDLGTWDAVAESGEGDIGLHVFEDAEGCLVRAPDGVVVAALGVRNLAIVVEADAVLVCDLSRAQDVKRVVHRVGALSPRHLDFPEAPMLSLEEEGARLATWLRLRALPLWASAGEIDGAYVSALSLDGRPIGAGFNAHVYAAQSLAFAKARRLQWSGCSKVEFDPDLAFSMETEVAETASLFLCAAAELLRSGSALPSIEERALGFLEKEMRQLETRENKRERREALLEACLSWSVTSKRSDWRVAASLLVGGLFDPTKVLRGQERTPGEGRSLVDPSRQFASASLLLRYGRMTGERQWIDKAENLYSLGMRGISIDRKVAVDSVALDGHVHSCRAKLSTQVKWLEAAVLMSQLFSHEDEERYLQSASSALQAIFQYITPDGVWCDDMRFDGKFIEEVSASLNLHRLIGALDVLLDSGYLGKVKNLR